MRAERGAGRPRDPRLDAAILAAARSLLAEVGYAAMSLESVAAVAGTSLPSVRRRYRSKADLVAAAIDSLRIAEPPKPSSDPRADALTVLRGLNRALLHNNAMTLVGSLLAEETRRPAYSRPTAADWSTHGARRCAAPSKTASGRANYPPI